MQRLSEGDEGYEIGLSSDTRDDFHRHEKSEDTRIKAELIRLMIGEGGRWKHGSKASITSEMQRE